MATIHTEREDINGDGVAGWIRGEKRAGERNIRSATGGRRRLCKSEKGKNEREGTQM